MYTVSEKNILRESRADSATPSVWFTKDIPDGDIDPATVAPGSYLTACTWLEGTARQIRVYHQDTKGHVQEVSCDGTVWTAGTQPVI